MKGAKCDMKCWPADRPADLNLVFSSCAETYIKGTILAKIHLENNIFVPRNYSISCSKIDCTLNLGNYVCTERRDMQQPCFYITPPTHPIIAVISTTLDNLARTNFHLTEKHMLLYTVIALMCAIAQKEKKIRHKAMAETSFQM